MPTSNLTPCQVVDDFIKSKKENFEMEDVITFVLLKNELENSNRKVVELLEEFAGKFPPKDNYIWGFAADGTLRQFYIGE